MDNPGYATSYLITHVIWQRLLIRNHRQVLLVLSGAEVFLRSLFAVKKTFYVKS